MPSEKIRYKVAAKSAPEFSNEFFVRCPKCDGCALLIPMRGPSVEDPGEVAVRNRASDHALAAELQTSLDPRHLECTKCRFRRSWNPGEPAFFRALVNWFGELALYLQVDCGNQTVWALNPAHLEFLEDQLRHVADDPSEPPSPLHEWLEHKSPHEIAECLSRLKCQPVGA